MDDSQRSAQWNNLRGALLLCAATVLAFAPMLPGGFLNYDDPWLIQNNPNLGPGTWDTPWRAFTALDRDARMSFGAEYLPLRDLSVWIETRVFGLWPQGMRAVNLLLYLGAALLMRGTLLRVLGRGLGAEIAALLFAVHPVHTESVAWLAGRKDVLALLFVAAALHAHAGSGRRRHLWMALWTLCACLSKSMSVAVLVLFPAQDLLLSRRPQLRDYAPAAGVVAACLAMHLYVGSVVGMVVPPPGGSRATAIITMGPVWLRYLGLMVYPPALSLVHDVPDRLQWDVLAVTGYAFVFGWAALGALGLRRGSALVAGSWLWFFAPLAPVSQVLAPLQNRLADRYAWLSVMAPCLLLGGWLGARPHSRVKLAAGALLAAALLVFSAQRSALFTDSVAVFYDATRKTSLATIAPYQLGKAFEAQGMGEQAETAFALVLLRAGDRPEPNAARATNNLARLLVRRGQLVQAEALLVRGVRRFPNNAKIRGNLVKVLAKQGRPEAAMAVEEGVWPSREP